jgi:subtilase family serine protease
MPGAVAGSCEAGISLKTSSILAERNLAIQNSGGETVFVTSGGTLDQYLCYPSTIYFDMYVNTNDSEIQSAVLTLSVYDVDEYCGEDCDGLCEVDKVYFNGHYLGKLTGADDTWSTVTFVLDPSWINGAVGGQPGVNHVVIYIDTLSQDCWCVEVDWAQLIINGGVSGNAEIVSMETDKESYKPGETVNVDIGITTDQQSQTVVLETNLFDIYGMNIGGTSGDVALTQGVVTHVNRQLQIPQDAKTGTYTVEAIIYDKNSGLRQDSRTVRIEVVSEPDFSVSNSDIEFTSVTKTSSFTVNVRVNVRYSNGEDPMTVKVEFYDLDLKSGTRTKISTQNVNLNPGSNYVYVTWHPANTDHVIQVIVDPDNAIKESDESNNVARKKLEGPQILGVKSKYKGYFLPGVSVKNTYYVETDGEVAKVEFDMDGNVKVDSNGNDGWSAEFDMGQLNHESVLKITAYSPSGVPSDTYVVKPAIVDIPSWLEEFILLSYAGGVHFAGWALTNLAHDNIFAYQYEKNLPDPPIKATITIPSWIPIVKGKYGIEIQFLYGFEFKTDGSATGYGGGGVSVAVAGKEASIAPKVSATVGLEKYIPPKIKLKGADGVIDGTVTIPALQFHLKIWKLDLGKIAVKIIPGVEGTLHFKEDESGTGFFPGLAWEETTAKLKTAIEGVGKIGKRTRGVEVAVGGEPSMTFGVPSPYFRSVAVKIYVKGTFSMFGYQKSKQASYEWSYPPTSTGISGKSYLLSATTTEWEPVPRDYAGSNYAIFRGSAVRVNALNQPTLNSLAVQENVIVENLYHYAYPWVATGGQYAILVWTHDDVTKPEVIGQEIYYSVWNGTGWSSPSSITNNYLIDWQPRVAFGTANAVAVWLLVDDPTVTSSTDPETFLDSVELAYSVYDYDTKTWTAPAKITDNSVFDGLHYITSSQNGNVLLVWVEDMDSNLTTIYDRNIHFAIWNGSAWQTSLVASNVAVDESPVVTSSNLYTVCAWIQDTDGNETTTEDRELYYSVFDGVSWSTPLRLTFDNYEDASPSLGYDTSGDIILAWVVRDALSMGNESWDILYTSRYDGSWMTPEIAAESGSIYENQLITDPDSNVVLVWQGGSDKGQDILYAVYDRANAHWSKARQLTDDEPAEWQISAGLTSSNNILVAYMKRSTTFFNYIPIEGSSNLYYLLHPVGYDAAVFESDISLSDQVPYPGETIQVSAKVHNLGDLGMDNIRVAFYANNNLIGTETITHLDATTNSTVSVPWTVPYTSDITIRVVVDYGDAISEINESNNEATKSFLLYDFYVGNVSYQYTSNGVTIIAEICNGGSISTNVNVALINAHNNTVGSSYLSPQPGSCVEKQWEVSPQDVTETLFVFVDMNNLITESNETNNFREVNLLLSPDLKILPEWVSMTSTSEGTVQIDVKVCNNGSATANNVSILIYENNSGCWFSGNIIASQYGVSLTAGQCTNVSFSWDTSSGMHNLSIVVNSSDLDIDISNNIACIPLLISPSPDLVVTEKDVSMSTNASGNLVLNIRVRNTGSTDANLVTVEIYNSSIEYTSPNPYITINPNKIGETILPVVPAGGYIDISITTSLIPATGKKYKVYVVIDRENAIIESNEDNNIAQLAYGGNPADVNGDTVVNFSDLIAVLNAILSGLNTPQYDVNGDTVVNFSDLIAVLNAILAGG